MAGGIISGRQALATIEQTIAQARNEETRFDAALKAAADQVARLRTERMDALRQLARVKLDAMTRDGVVRTLDAAERQALDLLAQRRQALERLIERRRGAEEAVRTAEAERHAKAAALEDALKAFTDLRRQVEAQTRNGPEWAAQRAKIDEAAAVAQEAEKKAAQAEADREAKRKPYEADPLFMYLWRKKFGTSEDRSGPFMRFFDRRVARLVGYDKARANYVALNEIPQRLREHAERMNAEIANTRARLVAYEREALLKAGIQPLAARAHAAKADLDLAERRLAEAKEALAALDREHDASVLQGEGPYRDAIELLATADAQESLQTLYREAMATPAPEDDAAVRRIEAIDGAVRRAEQEMEAIRRKLRDLAQRRAMVEQERDAFRQQGYDNPYGRFDNGNALGNVLGGILGGVIGGAVLRDTLNGGYHRQPSPWDSDFGGGGFPFPDDAGGGWIGGGSSDGGWSDGGGSGGDGFETGGTF
jgi:chromosome segregation ATPase